MKFAVRGVIEGFYGRPWSWDERERMIDFMAEHGFNLYVYAPKNDPIHRNRWQEPYLPEELERFGALARRCERHGIEFVFGISPLKFHYTDPECFAALWQKLLPIYRLGVRSFTILLDDMPDKFHYPEDGERFPTIADAQVWLNNAVLERLEALGEPCRLLFCPTEYHGEGVSDYLRTLGEGLRPEIDVFWTGTEICSQYLRTEDARKVSATLKRPILYWDNYPVNDGDMRFRPHIRPIRGRDADLHTACRGIVANGSLQPEATKISLHTLAQYFADPEGYEPEAAWQKALLEVTGSGEDAAAVAVLGDLTRWSALERGRQLDNSLLPKLARFWELWGGVPAAAGPELPDLPGAGTPSAAGSEAPGTTGGAGAGVAPPGAPAAKEAAPGTPAARAAAIAGMMAEFGRLQEVARRLQHQMANRHLQAELRPWAEKLQGWAEVGLLALSALNLALTDPHDARLPALRSAVLDHILTTRENFHWVAGDLIDQFARRCLWAARELEANPHA